MTTSISSTGSISSAGLGSGLDVNSIVSGLMAVESQPLTLLQNTATSLTTEVSAFGQLQSLTSSMRDAANALTMPSLWSQTTSSSADTTTVGVTTTGNATPSNYNVSVQNIAVAQTVSSSAFATSTTAVGQGSLTIQLGSWGTDTTGATTFTPNPTTSAPVKITIGPGDTSLSSIRDKINAANAGVSATIVNDASGARLAIRSTNTGTVNAFRITGSETPGDGTVGPGLASLTYDPSGTGSAMSLNQTAANANATINGIAVNSASNTLSGVADGLSLTLLKPTVSGTSVAVGVASDTSAVTTAVSSFVTGSLNSGLPCA